MILYENLDELPIYNYFMVFKTTDLKHLIKEGKVKDEQLLIDKWEDLNAEYLDVFGVNDALKNITDLRKQQAIHEFNSLYKVSPKSNADLQRVNLLLKDLESSEGGKTDYNAYFSHVEKFMGFQISKKDTSVIQFYSYVELMNKK